MSPEKQEAAKQALKNKRDAIDAIDLEILGLLNRRAETALDIARIKGSSGQAVFAPLRETEVLENLKAANRGPLSAAYLEGIYREIIAACRGLQGPMKVAYLGPECTFTHQTAISRFGRLSQFAPQTSIGDVFNEVKSGRAQVGVVPVENSSEGGVGVTLDQFLSSNLQVVGEIFAPISHCLMAKTQDQTTIKTVYSHPQALAQCRNWLARALPQALCVETTSTAGAAARAAREEGAAAVGAELAAAKNGLTVLARDIQDSADNTTRFLILGRDACPPSGSDKTSLAFIVSHKPGSLYAALKHLSAAGLNLTRIESRPTKQRSWEYAFFVDFMGHFQDANVAGALSALKGEVRLLKILGSYPEGEMPKSL